MKKAVIFQLFLIVLMLVVAVLPLKFGTPMQIRTRLYDPRDLFRGNYLDLNYDFLTISKSDEFSNYTQEILFMRCLKIKKMKKAD